MRVWMFVKGVLSGLVCRAKEMAGNRVVQGKGKAGDRVVPLPTATLAMARFLCLMLLASFLKIPLCYGETDFSLFHFNVEHNAQQRLEAWLNLNSHMQ